MPTYEEAIAAAGDALAASRISEEQMTPRELAEASWRPTSKHTVDELEAIIRADRGLPPRATKAS